MKVNLKCRIMGHKFIRIIKEVVTGPWSSYLIKEPCDFCVRCGLSKEELKQEAENEIPKQRD